MSKLGKISDAIASLVARLQRSMSEKRFLAVVAIAVGCVAGLGAALLKDLINYTSDLVMRIFPADQYNYLLLVLPLLGIVLCGLYCRYVVKDNLEFGSERIHENLVNKNYNLKPHIAYSPMVACSLTIGFGGSAGSEGPIAYAGAGIGSNMARLFRLSPDYQSLLIIIGAAAGIAGIFKAPVGGAMFALEVLAMPMTTVTVAALMFSCLASACIAYALSGFTIDISFMPKNFFDPGMIFGVIALGIVCSLYSMYYSQLLARTEKWFTSMSNPWVKNVVSGVLVGVLVFIAPVLFGEGYGVLDHIINGVDTDVMRDTILLNAKGPWVLLSFVTFVFLAKPIATGATNSGGGVGGDFAPTLFAGCMVGLAFAYFSNHYLGTHFEVANFALFGMAGVMAGIIQAPLMAIFLTLEMVGDFAMFFPLTICALISFASVRLLHRHVLHRHVRPGWIHGLLDKIKSI